MKILSVPQIREADAYTISNEPVSSIDLMERASYSCKTWLRKKFPESTRYVIVCGNGNNGGDGLAIARLLYKDGANVDVFIVKAATNDSADFTENFKRLPSGAGISTVVISAANDFSIPAFDNIVVIDALFGSGLTREPSGLAAEMIDRINKENATIVSIDIPSGLFGDDNRENSYKHVVRATHTLTFQLPKLSFLFAEHANYTGEFHVLDIGLHPVFLAQADTPFHFTTHADVKLIHRTREKFSHKGTYGHALLVAGGYGKMGAAVLSARACLRSGVGLLTTCIPKSGNSIMQTSVPEAMVIDSDGERMISGRIPAGKFSAIGIGPGIGTEKETEQALRLLLNEFAGPMVLDADALNILSENKTWLAFLPKGTILTPHPGEFDRLTTKHSTGFERLATQRDLAYRFGVYVVLKGAYTSIACPDGSVYFNSSGNPGMATGGSGDVLTGMLTALRAQGYDPQSACILGVYLHGLAGDIAAASLSQEAMIAGDLIENLSGAWRMLEEM